MMGWLGSLPPAVLQALIVGLFALPATLLAHRMGMKKQASELDAAFDGRMLQALEQRDKTIEAQNKSISDMFQSQSQLYRELGAAQAQITGLTHRQTERDEREREQIAELASLRAAVARLDSCAGGSPCPLASMRRTP